MTFLSWSASTCFIQSPPSNSIADFICCAGLAGIFSSEVTRAAGNETLIRSPDCGVLNSTNHGSQQALSAFEAIDARDTLAATTYSRACYGSTQNILQCAQYPKQQLPWKVNQNATCPFTNGICTYGGSSAYEMDTGYIDSHEALGVNAPKSERVQYRKVSTCKLPLHPRLPLCFGYLLDEILIQRTIGSPIHTKGYTTELNDTNPTDTDYGDILFQYNYGPVAGVSNYTYQYDVRNSLLSNGYSLT